MLTFKELDESTFEAFASRCSEGSFWQSAPMIRVLKRQPGRIVRTVGLEDGNAQVVAAALLVGDKVHMGYQFRVVHGYLVDFSDKDLVALMTKEIISYVRRLGGLYLVLSPNVVNETIQTRNGEKVSSHEHHPEAVGVLEDLGFVHQPFSKRMSGDSEPEWQYVKYLDGIADTEGLRKSFDLRARQRIRKSQSYGVELHQASPEELPEFTKITQETAERLHFQGKSLDYYQKCMEAYGDDARFVMATVNLPHYKAYLQERVRKLGQEATELREKLASIDDDEKNRRRKLNNSLKTVNSQLERTERMVDEADRFRKEADGDVILLSAALFLIRPQEIVYLESGTYDTYRTFDSPYLILDSMMRLAVEKGIPKFNFYGVSGCFDGSDGVLKFKEAFQGEVEQLVGNFVKPVRPLRYKLYKALKAIVR